MSQQHKKFKLEELETPKPHDSIKHMVSDWGDRKVTMEKVIIEESDVAGQKRALAAASRALEEARTRISFGFKFYSALIAYLPDKLKFKWEFPEGACYTAYTDGECITWAPEFVLALTKMELPVIMIHEVHHVAFSHLQRIGERDAKLWNYATDLQINHDLLSALLEMARSNNALKDLESWRMPGMGLIHHAFAGEASEHNYDRLMEAIEDQPPQQDDGQGGAGDGDSDGEDQQGQGQPGQGKGGISKDQAIKDLQRGRTTFGKPKGQTKDQADKQERDWTNRIITAVHVQSQSGSGIGSMPSSLQRLIDRLLEPVVDWTVALESVVRTAVTKTDYSWRRPSSRMISAGIIVPSLYDNSISEGVVIVDDSGSCYDDIPQFISEAVAIFKEFPSCKIHLVRCDSHPEYVCTWEPDQDDPTFAPSVTVNSGGGTSFVRPFSELLPESEWRPDFIVYLTDLDGPLPGPEHDPCCEVLWVVNNSRHSQEELPFGHLIRFERKRSKSE